MAKYTSGRQKNLKIGINSYSENLTSLEVIGKVGIGTTNATSKLWVDGDGYFTGILTANRIFSSQYGEFVGGSISGTSLVGTSLSISGISTLGVTSATNLTSQQLNVSGISTFGNSSIGISINGTTGIISSSNPGVTTVTFVGNLTGTATNLKDGVIGNIPYQSAADTTAFLTNGDSGKMLQSNGVGYAPTWVTPAPPAAITGLTIRDEGTVVGGANSVTALNFVGSIVSVASTAGIATITLSSNIVGTSLSITGISTFTNGPVLVGSGTSTGTASQPLQVTGGAYVSGSVGIGTTSPAFKADIAGDARVTSTNKMRFGGTAGTTNFYIQYNSTANSLDFVAG